MNKYIYLREPGILYDMMFAMKLRFNGERAFVEPMDNSPTGSGVIQLYRQVIKQLEDVSDKLLPLFYSTNEPQIKTGLLAYMRIYLDEFGYTTDGLIDRFYESLRNTDRLKEFIYRNYISSDCPEDFDFTSFTEIKESILSSELPNDVKLYLINFMLDGQNEIDLIITELKKAQIICEKLHQLNSDRISDLVSQFDDEKIAALSKLQRWDIKQFDPIYHTYCSLHTYSAYGETRDGNYMIFLGIDGDEVIQEYTSVEINLYELGRILYDETRLKILEMLSEKPMYCAEIAKKLGLKNNSTLYHLNMMEKQKLIIPSPTGKKLYYTININYIDSLKKHLDIIRLEITRCKKNN